MRKNELNQPLHRATEPNTPAPRRRSLLAPVLISAAGVLAVIAAFWVAVVDDPDGGRPVAVASIEEAAPAATGSVASEELREGPDAPPQLAAPSDAAPPVTAPPATAQPDEMELAGLPVIPAAISGDPSLFEQSNFGLLPRVSPDGRRPREAYARRSPPVPDGVPRIVVVVGGLGLSQTGTQTAIDTLPEDVTLAFAPYGASLERWVGKARGDGHEVLLQVPLEPLNYPDENPGEHTLLAAAGGANRQDLHWVLGRMTGYAGVMNHMGARFTRDERALVPFLGEIGARGLFYLDDGSSEESVAATIGAALRVPVITADRTIDRVRSVAAIERELVALEAIARTQGLAVGVASAFPASVQAITNWARDAETRGIVIIPASAATGP